MEEKKDTVTILFSLAHGATPRGKRAEWNIISHLQHHPLEVHIDPNREDFGLGDMLDDPEIIGVHVAWLDNYGDNQEPILAVTGLYRPAHSGSSDAKMALNVMPAAIKVPALPSSAHIAEWIATYMRDNVYHDSRDS
jgi:hypothetical protein